MPPPIRPVPSIRADLHVSLVGRKNLANDIYAQLRSAILDGRLQPGERLPATRELSQQLAVSRTTINKVYERLQAEGFTDPQVGRGMSVAHEVRPRSLPSATPAGALRARPIWDSIPRPTAFRRAFEFDFRSGIPDVGQFPIDAWRRRQAREWTRSAIGQGLYGDPGGDPGLRAAIAEHISIARGVKATGDDVVVTNGTQQAADIIFRALIGPGNVVAVEDPGYPPPRQLLRSLGARIAGVPVDEEGLVVDAIPKDARVVLVTPTHQYPLGMAMSLRRRMALLAWAGKHDAAIVEDDYDSEFRFAGRPIEPLQTLDDSGRVIYVGTFSKTMLATIRVGFVVTPRSIRHAVEAAKLVTDWHSPLPTQRALAAFIRDGSFARHVRRMRSVYRARHDRIAAILQRDFAAELRVVPAAAGVHIAALAPSHSVAQIAAVVGRAAEASVGVQPLAFFAVGKDERAGIVFGYGAIATEDIDEGLGRLKDAFSAG